MQKRHRILVLCVLLLLAAVALSIMTGSYSISPSDLLTTLLNKGSRTHTFAIFQIRLPRIVLAILVGSALGVSGTILQGITKNPLAEPGMIGINAGSALFVVLWISHGANAYSSSLSDGKVLLMPLLAIAGAFCTTAFLYGYSWRNGIRPIRFLLTGVGVNAGITAVISFYQLQMSRGDYNQVLMWTNGSLWGSSWRYILVSAPLILLLLVLVWTHSRTLDILSLGDEGAAALGVSTQRTRIWFLAAAAALAALATAVAGSIAFLGLLGPQIALRIAGVRHRLLLPLAALISSMLLIIADMLARNLFSPLEIP
ncbi:MAG: FecCD family ABC transporter permease, partial [[Clostridium] innocuum]